MKEIKETNEVNEIEELVVRLAKVQARNIIHRELTTKEQKEIFNKVMCNLYVLVGQAISDSFGSEVF